MEYPSFLWGNGIGENRSRCPIIRENVLTDLKIGELVRGEVQKKVLIPCNAAEIRQRQAIFRALGSNPKAVEALEEIKNAVNEYKKSCHAYEISETEREKAMFFAVFVSTFLDLCRALAALDESDGVFERISEEFRSLLQSELIRGLDEAIRVCFASRGEHVRVRIGESTVTAHPNTVPMQQRFAQWFRIMGIEEELPKNRSRRRPDAFCLEAYGEIYSSFTRQAEHIYKKYREPLLGEPYGISELVCYGDEISFLLEGKRVIDRFRDCGFPLCYPTAAAERKITVRGLVDAALLSRGLTGAEIVPNDVDMAEEASGERLHFFILSGANGGGKTTYLRAVGNCVLMFLLGLPITAEEGEIYPFRQIFTHFPSNEGFEGNGRFVDEERRVKEITASADGDTVALFNETYSGTDEKKSEDYSRRLIGEMWEKGVFGLFVTHIHSLTTGDIPVLSAEVEEEDENKRTYRIRRVKTTHSSFACDILKKYRLDRESLEAVSGRMCKRNCK